MANGEGLISGDGRSITFRSVNDPMRECVGDGINCIDYEINPTHLRQWRAP
ncbi:hypothetical protein ACQP1U_04175 [Actinomycetota bacterium]